MRGNKIWIKVIVNLVKHLLPGIFFYKKHRVSELKWAVLETVHGKNIFQIRKRLLQRELCWIVRMETQAPLSLNESCNFTCM